MLNSAYTTTMSFQPMRYAKLTTLMLNVSRQSLGWQVRRLVLKIWSESLSMNCGSL
jgi:hypothetical protein